MNARAFLQRHCGRDREYAEWRQWVGPLGIGAHGWEISFRIWLPRLSWIWGYWR